VITQFSDSIIFNFMFKQPFGVIRYKHLHENFSNRKNQSANQGAIVTFEETTARKFAV